MRNLPRTVLLASIAICVPLEVLATDRYYRDRTVLSPTARWRLEAKSPDNAGPGLRPFAAKFTYTLYDHNAGTRVWSRAQPEKESSPNSIFVHDEKWVVIWTGWDQLVVLEPAAGKTVLTLDILEQFPEAERAQYVHMSTAGPIWAGHSRWSFEKIDENLYFVIRAWWDRRIIVDLKKLQTVADKGRIREHLDANDTGFVLATLRQYATATQPSVSDCSGAAEELYDAIHIAGRMKIHDAAPALEAIEKWEDQWSGSSFGGDAWDLKLSPGDVNPFEYESSDRGEIQLALRRIGVKPACYPSTSFDFVGKKGKTGKKVPVASPNPKRAEQAGNVKAGMKPLDVLKLIGPPDYLPRLRHDHWRTMWEYDMDTDPPFTLRILWDKNARVERTEKMTPAVWQTENGRYEE